MKLTIPKKLPGNPKKFIIVQSISAGELLINPREGTVDASDKLMQPTFSKESSHHFYFKRQNEETCVNFHLPAVFVSFLLRVSSEIQAVSTIRFASVKRRAMAAQESSQKSNHPLDPQQYLQVPPVAGVLPAPTFPTQPAGHRDRRGDPPLPPLQGGPRFTGIFGSQKTWPKGGIVCGEFVWNMCPNFVPTKTRWWFQVFFIFIPIWGNDPFWLICFKGVGSTTN